MVQIYLSMSLRSVVNVIKLIGHNVEKTDSSDEFGDPSQKYLCITLGPDRGVSAGIPYVLGPQSVAAQYTIMESALP